MRKNRTSERGTSRVVKKGAKTRKAVAKPGPFDDVRPIRKGKTEAAVIREAAEAVEITPKQARSFVLELQKHIVGSLMKGGFGSAKALGFTFKAKHIPASKGGKKMFMPMLDRTIITKPKPATSRVRALATKRLKMAIAAA